MGALDPVIALERIRNIHKPCHMASGYRTAGYCDAQEHAAEDPADCITCASAASPCPTLREVESALRVSRCAETHNPGAWPYVARCVQTAEPHTWHEDAKGRGWST